MTDLGTTLAKANLIKHGNFKLSGGGQSNVYVDLRAIIGYPDLMERTADECVVKMRDIPHHLVAAVPYGALPIATLVAYLSDKPLVYVRRELKGWGIQSRVEGVWIAGQKAVIIDDVITTGKSVLQTAEMLRDMDIRVEHAVVVVDREQGGKQNLLRHNINLHAILSIEELL